MIRRIAYTAAAIALFVVLNSTAVAGFSPSSPTAVQQLIAKHRAAIDSHQGALVLKNSVRVNLFDSERVEAIYYSAIAVTDDRAVQDYTQISVGFNAHYEQIQLEFARLIDSAGHIYTVAEDAIQIQTQSRAATYDDIRQLVFSLPRLEKNSVLEFQYRINTKKPIIDRAWYDRISLQRIHYVSGTSKVRVDPLLEAQLWVDAPNNVAILHQINNAKVKPQISAAGLRKHYRWQLSNIPGISIESAMQALTSMIPYIEISTIDSWQAVDQWAKRYYLPRVDAALLSDQIKDFSQFKQLGSLDKVRAVYQYVQENIRYIEADFSRGGMIPHLPTQVLNNRYGDCKDQAVLIVALLRELGVTAYPALTSVYPDANVVEGVPSLNFSHAIVYVEQEGQTMFLDTSGDTGLFPGIDWSLEGATALVLDGRGGKLVTVPRRIAQDNSINIEVEYQFVVPDVQLRFSMGATGAIGNRYKAWLEANADAESEVADVLEQVFSGALVTDVQVLNMHDKREPAMIKSHIVYQNAFRSLSEKIKLEGSLGALVRSFTGTLPLVDPDKRLNDYFVKVPYQINYSAKIDSPSEYHKGIVFQSGSNVENGLLELQNQHEIKSNEIELRYQFSLARGVVKKDAYDAFYSAFEAALLESQWVITFLFDNANYKKHALVQQGDDVEAMVKLAQHHLFLGEYEDAVSIGKRTIKLFPEHGGAHYVLGLSYGFIDEFEQSDREIRKAKSLGYRP